MHGLIQKRKKEKKKIDIKVLFTNNVFSTIIYFIILIIIRSSLTINTLRFVLTICNHEWPNDHLKII